MTSSSARLVNQRYNAGSCTLDVALQMSALSQWYSQPLAQSVHFKLWLRSADNTAPQLVAEGDSEALQAIVQYLQQQIRATLVLANLNAPLTLPTPAQLPSGQPLSHLQLCDLTSVLSQYEQATQVLPVALNSAIADAQTSLQASRQSQPALRTSGLLIPFASVRRRPKLWASSAAAAVFAVGITTALWPQIADQANQTIADGTVLNSEPALESTPGSAPRAASERAADIPRQQQSQPKPSKPAPSASTGTASRSPSARPDANPSVTQPSVNPPAAGSDSSQLSHDSSAKAPASADPTGPVASTEARGQSSRDTGRDRIYTASPDQPAAITDSPAPVGSNPAPSAASENPEATASAARQSSPRADAAIESAAPVPASGPEADTVAQVQAYFQTRWQPDGSGQSSLSYRLELSAAGEVVSFTALDEASGERRDRLLPADNPPTFSPLATYSESESTSGLTLTLVFTADGQVQVSKL